MKIILDTNAFLNIFELECNRGYTTPLKIIDSEYLLELFKSNDCYITSVTLYELLVQSIERDPKNWINQFENYFNFLRNKFKNGKTSLLNEKSEMYFDFEKFRNNYKNNINNFLSTKLETEKFYIIVIMRLISLCIVYLYFDKFGDCVEETVYSNILDEIWKNAVQDIDSILCERYIKRSIDNEKLDILLNKVLFDALYKNIEFITNNISIPINEEEAIFIQTFNSDIYLEYGQPTAKSLYDGAKYINKIISKFKKQGININKHIENTLNKFYNEAPDKLDIEKNYLNYLISRCINKMCRIRKNDVSDYLIATVGHYVDEMFEKKEEVIILTFDKTMYSFLKNYKYFYNEEVYKNLKKK